MFDCSKCKMVGEARAEAGRLRREVERLLALERARTEAAMTNQGVTLSEAAVAEVLKRIYHPAFEQVVRVPVDIALSPAEEAKDRLKAVQMVTERVAGKVPDRLQHSGGIALSAVGTLEIFVHPSCPTETAP